MSWPLGTFDVIGRFGHRHSRRYPIRYLRYWFVRRLLEELHARRKRPLNVLEIGVDRGQMLAFLGGSPLEGDRFALPDWIARWDGIDVNVDPSTRDRYSYSSLAKVDIERPFDLEKQAYDAVICLHVLEHLFEPEVAMHHIGKGLAIDGLLIGGSPTMPAWLAPMQERFLRWKFRKVLDNVNAHRHLSVITPTRIYRFAKQNGLETELLAGTFFFRWSGVFLEDLEWWPRANLAWGALFPSLGGEINFSLRKRRDP